MTPTVADIAKIKAAWDRDIAEWRAKVEAMRKALELVQESTEWTCMEADTQEAVCSVLSEKRAEDMASLLRAALEETRIDLVILRGNVAQEARLNCRWEGMADLVREWIARIDGALAGSTPEKKGETDA